MNLSANERLRGLIAGYQVSQAIAAAVVLGIPEQLASGPRRVGDLAASLGIDAYALRRLLRLLTAVDVVHVSRGGSYILSEMGQDLLENAPRTLAHRARLTCSPFIWRSWAGFADSIVSGTSAFEAVHGADCWAYLDKNAADAGVFNAAMSADSRWMADSIAAAYDFSRFAQVVDLGGGEGNLLAALLEATPSMRGVLFEQPDIASRAARYFDKLGLTSRCDVVAGSFFDAVPKGADAYLLKWVLHDWPDDLAIKILLKCREAMAPNGRIVIVEHAIDDDNPALAPSLVDLTMLVVTGGKERTHGEYEDLLAQAGCRLLNVVSTDCQLNILEAAPIA
jgi:O-methyltransferase domain/Dimerisation domain